MTLECFYLCAGGVDGPNSSWVRCWCLIYLDDRMN